MIAIFMAKRIKDSKNTYTEVITARPDLKDDIDSWLIENGYESLIV